MDTTWNFYWNSTGFHTCANKKNGTGNNYNFIVGQKLFCRYCLVAKLS